MKDDTIITMFTLIPEPFPQWDCHHEELVCGEVEKMKRDSDRNETNCRGAAANKAS
ncbi:hypothetical protein BAC3_00783 [uncultured bacterium]|nr:hypothetical protein BAC3_00783 [uncultured bacterium]